MPIRLFSLALVVAFATAPLRAQVGYLHIQPHLPGEPDSRDRLVLRASISTGSGSRQLDSYALEPGDYVLTEVVTLIGNCYASTQDVPFTIVAGQWTTVKPLVQFSTCFYQANPRTEQGGEGKVTATDGVVGHPPVDCTLVRTDTNDWRIDGFESCRGESGYGASLFITQHALAGSSLFAHLGSPDDSVTLVVDTTDAIPLELAQIFLAQDFDDTAETGQVADLSVSRLASSLQGRLMRSTFRVTNHGPGHALDVQPAYSFNGNIPSVGGNALFLIEPSRGNCRVDNHCTVPDLPPGQTADFTLVRYAFPNSTSAPTGDPRCLQFAVVPGRSLDPDLSNNSISCLNDSVSVTVTAGNGTPTPLTVVAGSAAVPVLRFGLTPATTFSLTDITLSASGSGNESVDVTSVKLFADLNGNGLIDNGDPQLAAGTFGDNDGTVTLTLEPPYGISAPASFLVTYDFNVSVAARLGSGLGFGLLGLVSMQGLYRRRRWVGLAFGLLLVLGLSRCGGDSGGPSHTGNPTFRATLTGLSADGVAVPNVSVPGATITVTR